MDSVGGERELKSPCISGGRHLEGYIFQLPLDTDEGPSSSVERPGSRNRDVEE
jgi:hypothetical protein